MSNRKSKPKKKIKLAPTIELDRDVHYVWVVAAIRVVLVIVVRAVGRRCWLHSVCSRSRLGVGHRGWLRGSQLGSGVALFVGAWRRAAF